MFAVFKVKHLAELHRELLEVNKQQLMQHTDVTWKALLSLRALSELASCNLYLCYKPTRTGFPNKAHIAQVAINFVRFTMSNTTKQGEDARALFAAATSLLARTLKLHVRFDSAATQFHSFIPAMYGGNGSADSDEESTQSCEEC